MYLTTNCALGYYIYFCNFEPNVNFSFSDGINLNPSSGNNITSFHRFGSDSEARSCLMRSIFKITFYVCFIQKDHVTLEGMSV